MLQSQLDPVDGKAKVQRCLGGPGGEEQGVLPTCGPWRGRVEDRPWSLSGPSAGGPSVVPTHPGPRAPPSSVHSRTKDLLQHVHGAQRPQFLLLRTSSWAQVSVHEDPPGCAYLVPATRSHGTLHLPKGSRSGGDAGPTRVNVRCQGRAGTMRTAGPQEGDAVL